MALLRGDWTEFLEHSAQPSLERTGSRAFLRQNELFYDLMWADPTRDETPVDARGFGESYRGVGCTYGQKAVDEFLRVTGVQMVLRAHEAKGTGFHIQKSCKIVTVFSSGMYNDVDDVAGAVFINPEGDVRFMMRSRS
eukprot:NODE_4188_length_688_cov_67.029734_g3556_i0.p1 GENE.NODE_4188_length_688_cov_67.029734_g3556_i0~~NODE_4188_length_688_cov_67.029734_g3556_i0.p1  ORF type:complete len:138 (+),score=35.23 NODE_4188_length_688_cov_67.029734_g3556_i0:140-553(+)